MPSLGDTVISHTAISFGPFRLLPVQRLLLEGDKPLRLGSRALDILIALVERAGELVGKDQLMARVWPNMFVEPANLTVHVAKLRRILGDGRGGNRYLLNIPGRGYRFVAPVTVAEGAKLLAPSTSTEESMATIAALERMVGRQALEIEFLKWALISAPRPRSGTTSVPPKISGDRRKIAGGR